MPHHSAVERALLCVESLRPRVDQIETWQAALTRLIAEVQVPSDDEPQVVQEILTSFHQEMMVPEPTAMALATQLSSEMQAKFPSVSNLGIGVTGSLVHGGAMIRKAISQGRYMIGDVDAFILSDTLLTPNQQTELADWAEARLAELGQQMLGYDVTFCPHVNLREIQLKNLHSEAEAAEVLHWIRFLSLRLRNHETDPDYEDNSLYDALHLTRKMNYFNWVVPTHLYEQNLFWLSKALGHLATNDSDQLIDVIEGLWFGWSQIHNIAGKHCTMITPDDQVTDSKLELALEVIMPSAQVMSLPFLGWIQSSVLAGGSPAT